MKRASVRVRRGDKRTRPATAASAADRCAAVAERPPQTFAEALQLRQALLFQTVQIGDLRDQPLVDELVHDLHTQSFDVHGVS